MISSWSSWDHQISSWYDDNIWISRWSHHGIMTSFIENHGAPKKCTHVGVRRPRSPPKEMLTKGVRPPESHSTLPCINVDPPPSVHSLRWGGAWGAQGWILGVRGRTPRALGANYQSSRAHPMGPNGWKNIPEIGLCVKSVKNRTIANIQKGLRSRTE